MSCQSLDVEERTAKRRKVNGRRKTACQACSTRKVRCSNDRPTCLQCRNSQSDCVYLGEQSDDLTLNRVFDILSSQIEHLTRKVDDLSTINAHSQTSEPAAEQEIFQTDLLRTTSAATQNAFVAPNDFHSSRDFARIPPHRTTADEVLTWPIFGNAFPKNYLIDVHLGFKSTDENTSSGDLEQHDEIVTVSHSVAPLDEHRIPVLVDRFLENVHTKNPILDVELLVRKARQHASQGLVWDGYSCLLLLACALGTISKPFGSEVGALDSNMTIEQARELASPAREKLQADSCFLQASRRLGSLRPSLLASQCNFFAGVYLMYTLRPMLSWQFFHQASTSFQLYLKMNGRVCDDNSIVTDPASLLSTASNKIRQQEQRLFWSVFKSESEFRIELPLPQSEIADYDFPDLFPSPPLPVVANGSTDSTHIGPSSSISDPSNNLICRTLSGQEDDEIRKHAKRLCNEEESWYYYLTEIALRRIGNRVINTFFRQNNQEWMNIEQYIDVAIEYEVQVSTWQTNLPSVMQKYEINSTIRAPRIASPGGAEAGCVSRELSWATENRLLEMRHWLYQPFLYFLIHRRPPIPTDLHRGESQPFSPSLSPNESADNDQTFWALIIRAIDCNLAILETRTLPHRHHGLWFDLRNIICASLIMLGVVKSGYESLIPGGREVLVGDRYIGPSSLASRDTPPTSDSLIQGQLGRVLRQLEIWSHESSDMLRARKVLLMLIPQILGS